jgi:superfamily I DNA/RNA helicase
VPHATDGAYPPWSPPGTSLKEIEKRKQEACRLLYVAISRPKQKLIVSYHKKFKSWDRKLSEFLRPCEAVFSWPVKQQSK